MGEWTRPHSGSFERERGRVSQPPTPKGLCRRLGEYWGDLERCRGKNFGSEPHDICPAAEQPVSALLSPKVHRPRRHGGGAHQPASSESPATPCYGSTMTRYEIIPDGPLNFAVMVNFPNGHSAVQRSFAMEAEARQWIAERITANSGPRSAA